MMIKRGLLLLIVIIVLGNSTELQRDGWNLVSICQDINKSDINMTGIKEIQNQDGLSIYTGEFASKSNLDVLEAGYGYWVKGNAGIQFDSKESINRLAKPLSRDGWNLMASCEDIPKNEVNMKDIKEIQNQDGQTIYTGEWNQFSNLNFLKNGYGYWVKGVKGTEYTSKKGLSIPINFTHQAINNRGNFVEMDYYGYKIKLYSDSNITADAQMSHIGIIVNINGANLPIMQVQQSYVGSDLVVAVYDATGVRLVGVTEPISISGNSTIPLTLSNQRINNHPPLFSKTLSDINMSKGSTHSFHVHATDVDGNKLEYKWFINDKLKDIRGVDFTYTFDTVGIFNIKCKVSDGDLGDITEANVNVKNSIGNISKLNGKAEIKGVLSNADVRIFKIETNGSKTLLYSEWTNQYGEFNVHQNDLDDNRFYIYEVSKGVDTFNLMTNRGTIHAIVKGEFAKSNEFTVSILSEMLYVFSAKDTKYDYSVASLQKSLNRHIKTLLLEDIDGSGEINYIDSLLFKYENDSASLNQLRYRHIEHLLTYIYSNRGLIFAENILSPLIGSFDTSGFADDIMLSKDGTKAFIADSNKGLKIIDISDPVTPFLIEKFDITNANSVKLSADERRAYVGGSAGVSVVDISNLHQLSLVSIFELPNTNTIGITLSHDETKLFASSSATYSRKINVIDISDDTNLSLIKILDYAYMNSRARVVLSKDDSRAFIAEDKFYIVDISDITHPKSVGVVQKEGSDVTFNGINEMVLSKDETKVFVVNSTGLRIIDISNLSAPTIMGTFDTIGYAYGVTLSEDGNRAFIADGDRGVKVVDVSNPYKPYLLGNVDTHKAQKIRLSTDESKVYVADESEGLKIIDVSDLVNPLLPIENFNTFGEAWSLTLSEDERQIFVSERAFGFETIDISNPLDLHLLGKFDASVQDLVLSNDGNRAFVAALSQLKIIDISDPAHKTLISAFDVSAYKIILSADNDKAFILGSRELNVIDISDPLNMTLIDSFNLNSSPQNMTISTDGTKAFVTYSDYSRGVQIIDISDPSNLSSIKNIYLNDTYPNGITLSSDNTKAFIASRTQGIKILDIRSGMIVGSFDTMIDDAQMLVLSADNKKAFIADGYGGVKIIDITDLAHPSLLGRFDTIGYANMLILSKDESKVYVADRVGGVQIIDLNILININF